MIEAVLWDFSGVFTGSPFRGLADYGARLGTTDDQLVDWLLGYSLDDCDHAWHRLERGEVTFQFALESCERAAAEAGVAIDRREPLQSLAGGERGVRTPVVDKVRSLAGRGYRNGIITNNVREFADGWRRMIPIELFEVVVDSSEAGLRKPNPAIYELALERLGGLEPGRAVFLDDYPGNVDAARRVGMQGIVVGSDVSEALDELDALLAASRVSRPA